MLKRISLRARLTLLTAVILTAVCALLTYSSLYNVRGTWNLMAKAVELTAVIEAEEATAVAGEMPHASFTPTTPTVPMSVVMLNTEQRRFKADSFLYMLLLMVLGTGAVYLVLGRALKPMKHLSETILEIDQHHLSMRVEGIQTEDEIGNLAHSFNHMMDRLDASFMRQKQFAMNAAHELKTPLSIMQTAVQVLDMEEEPDVADYKDTLHLMHTSVKRLSTLVDDLLYLADAGDETTRTAVHLKTMLQEIKKDLVGRLAEKEITLDLYAEDDLIYYGQRELLYRTLFNLTENAIKYNRQKGRIRLKATEPGDFLVFVVEDNGLGIPEEELSRIFEPLYRVERSRNRSIAGAGLGLSIVKAAVEKMEGEIQVESRVQAGTIFTITLPKEGHQLC